MLFSHIDQDIIVHIIKKAGEATLEIYDKSFSVKTKNDRSPLTEADIVANDIICSFLASHYPDIPVLSEENKTVPYEVRKSWEIYWCIDPIDGTKEFINRNGEFTINIALIYRNEPVIGAVFAPALDELYIAKKGEGAYKNGIRLTAKSSSSQRLRVVASRSHMTEETKRFIDELPSDNIEIVSKGSSLKLCMVAEGSADIYPRLAPTMEWDTAAADAIVREAGKMTYRYDTDEPLRYNKENLLNPWFVVR